MRSKAIVILFLALTAVSCNFFKGKPPADVYLANDLDSLERPSLPMPGSEQVLLSLVQDTTMKQGFVRVRMLIDEYGKVKEPKVVNKLGVREDSVALARVKALPDFIPGRIQGRAVKSIHFMAFIFNPDGSSYSAR